MPDNSRKAKKSSKYPLIEICHNTSCRSRGGAEALLHDIEDLCQGRVKVKSRVCMDHCGKGPNMTLTRSAHNETEELIGVDSFGKVVKYIEDVTEHKLIKNDKKLGLFKYEYRRAKHDYDKVTFLSEAISFVRENKDAAALAGLLVLRAEYFLEKYRDSALKDAEKAILLEPSLKEGYAVLARALAACGQLDEAKSTLLSAEELGLSKDQAHHIRKKMQAINRKSTRSLHNSDIPAIADWDAMTKDAKEKSKIAKAEEERKKTEKAAQEEEGSIRGSKNGVKTVPLTLKANNYGIESNMPPDGPVKRVDMIDIEDLAFYAVGGPVSLCRCYKSKNFPYCDGSHNVHNEETKDNAGPVIIKRNAPKSDCSVLHSEEEKTKIVNGPRANNYGVISNLPPDKPCKRVDILDLCTVKEIVAEEGVARLCRCYASSKFPFCDGSHDCHNEERKDNAGPIVLKCLQPKRGMDSKTQGKTSHTEKADIRGSNVNVECDKDCGKKGICVQEEATQVAVAQEITRGDDVVLRDRVVPISGNLHLHEENEQRARTSNGPSNGRCLFTGLCCVKGIDAFDGEG